ncbi:MAG: hypothetical protein PWR01_1960 [Clostridiales bacterium]|jgi:ankyrin repeat protein|nr:hypothetical protein [Clostridiales bacterium]MDN5280887.1 hypothetical protein [Candidatus Ozemobacter sp.]
MGKYTTWKLKKFLTFLILIPWTAIWIYPAAWYLVQSDTTQRRIATWETYVAGRGSKMMPAIDLYHWFFFPDHNAVIKGKIHKIAWNDLNEANIDQLDSFGFSCLGYAAIYDESEIAANLLQKKATVDLTMTDGNSALLLTAKHQSTKTCKLLLEAGARADLQNIRGETPLHHAALNKFETLISSADVKTTNFDVTDKRGYTPLDWAISKNRLNEILALAIAGAKPVANIKVKSPMIETYLALCQKSGDPVKSAMLIAERDKASPFQKLKHRWNYPAELPVDLGIRQNSRQEVKQ